MRRPPPLLPLLTVYAALVGFLYLAYRGFERVFVVGGCREACEERGASLVAVARACVCSDEARLPMRGAVWVPVSAIATTAIVAGLVFALRRRWLGRGKTGAKEV